MSDLNRVVLTGRLTADPDLKFTQSGRAMLRFDIAVNRRWVNPESGQPEEEVTFLPIVVWGKQAENCAAYLRKGRQVAVDGRLRVRSFTTQNGDRRRATEVVAQSVHFLGGRPTTAEPQPTEEGTEIPPDSSPEEEVPF
ncbi:MAG TPA: single-stranded DNA-binding protein [Candidatus Bipolaricaulis sp.]|nr:single-stranded DNA-binding protein [Candidatus Bipolaricaulis sp.]MDY0392569.1 single-stranded DNA-binding protein [Candidatus Bipolaricaulis sp.]HPD07388.1 single-stranded DNA-binding protein [Candidatus Bipolaricaulis sp.]HRU22278.1 single-stranded DNA-binding protein [Candidatus Bipolaricaulis sp.]